MNCKRVDEQTDRIIMCDVQQDIIRAFSELEYELKAGVMCRKLDEKSKKIVKEKASQIKKNIESYIDSQVARIIEEDSKQKERFSREAIFQGSQLAIHGTHEAEQ